MTVTRPFLPLMAALLLLPLGCSRCGEQVAPATVPVAHQEAAGEPEAGGRVRIAYREPVHLNPDLDGANSYTWWIGNYLLEGLVAYDPATLEKVPQLAERWTISPDRKVVTFTLRRGVRWHDGTPFTARDVAFTFNAIKDPANRTVSARTYLEHCQRVVVIDDHTVAFHWDRPYFMAIGAMARMKILPRHLYEGAPFNTHSNNRAPVGTGPYRFGEWETGSYLRLERNGDYWGRSSYLDEILIRFQSESAVTLQSFMSGDLDWAATSPDQWKQYRARFESNPDWRTLSYYLPTFDFIVWNNRQGIFADRRVREAMARLVDLDTINQALYGGAYQRITGPFLPGTGGNDPTLAPVAFDPVGARELLAEAGWRDSDGDGVLDRKGEPFAFELRVVSAGSDALVLPTLLRDAYRKAGIRMTIRPLEWATFLADIRDHRFEAAYLAWRVEEEQDPYASWHSSQSAAGENYAGYADPAVDSLLEAARSELDTARRQSLYREVHGHLYRDQPCLFLFRQGANVVYHRRLHDFQAFPISTVHDGRRWWIPAALRLETEPAGALSR